MKSFKEYINEQIQPKASVRDLYIFPLLRKHKNLMKRANDLEINFLWNYIDILNKNYLETKNVRIPLAIGFFQGIIATYILDIYIREFIKGYTYDKVPFKDFLKQHPIIKNLTNNDDIMKEFERIYDLNSPIRVYTYYFNIGMRETFPNDDFSKFYSYINNNKREWNKR